MAMPSTTEPRDSREATPGPSTILDPSFSSGSPASSSTSSSMRLDAVLYNFYSKSVNLVAANRLTHSTFTALTDSGSVGHVNKWFSLPLPDIDIFKEELRLWRSLSAFVPPSALEASIETPADDAAGAPLVARVPPLVLEVIFEPVKGPTATSPRPVVLERWRIDFTVFQPESAPELQDLYKRCSTHLQAFDAATRNLPAYKLYKRIRTGDGAAVGQIGCRLGTGEALDVGTPSGDRREIGLGGGDEENASSSQTGLHGFAPLVTPLGSLTVSVEYRENLALAGNVRPDDLRPDEDYFKPPITTTKPTPSAPTSSKVSAPAGGSSFSDRPSPPPQPQPSISSSPSSFGRMNTSGPPRAGLSALRSQPTPTDPPLSSSPGAGEPAFLTSHARRTSSSSLSSTHSERRFRTASTLGPAGSSGSGIAEHPAGSVGIGRPALPQQMRFGSYSPSSPSPLAQQAAGAESGASSRSIRPTAASVAKPSSTPPTHSLRNIFQHYAPTNVASSSSPASNSSIVSLSGTSRPTYRRAGSGGSSGSHELPRVTEAPAPASSSSGASRPSVSPQMIQRYSRTPSYRSQHPGQQAGRNSLEGAEGRASTSSGEVQSGGAGRSPSFSRSWQARTEARQQAMMAMAGSSASRGSPSSLLSRASPGSLLSRESPPAQQKRASGVGRRDSIDDLVSLIESRPMLAGSSSPRPQAPQAPPAATGGFVPSQSPALGSSALASSGSSRVMLSTSAMDDMLAKMTQSVMRLTAPPAPMPVAPDEAATSAPALPAVSSGHTGEPVNSCSSPSAAAGQVLRPPTAPLAPDFDDSSSFEGGRGAMLRGRLYPRSAGAGRGAGATRGGHSSHEEVDAILLQAHDDDYPTAIGPEQQSQRETRRQASDVGAALAPRGRHSFDYEDEEEHPAGRLELHSDPNTPTSLRFSSSPLLSQPQTALTGAAPGAAGYSRFAGRTSTAAAAGATAGGALGLGRTLRASAGSDVDEAASPSNLFAHRTPSGAAGVERVRSSSSAADPSAASSGRRFRRYVSGFDVGTGAAGGNAAQREGEDQEPDDAQRLRSFGAELSSMRGRGGAPWSSYGLTATATTTAGSTTITGGHGVGSSSPWRTRRPPVPPSSGRGLGGPPAAGLGRRASPGHLRTLQHRGGEDTTMSGGGGNGNGYGSGEERGRTGAPATTTPTSSRQRWWEYQNERGGDED
ncbi:hypothetical protein BDZ90DRAFT_233976 [Jaminaea rosea]|uniref:Autophagy-related protein 13 n=1 Tax=Jaminaea rosea TaxID=1569628 RepID=A0A316UJR9_9BASI|nr:hypothetical protein BDZ90DRAFT_233976 [Jaminaea rosea]PWN25532.1 hypothetical protein BDZ90DRAFT_233976 [Jaminaea rosea]